MDGSVMDQGIITCPNCGHQFEISDALTAQIREHLKGEMQQEIINREKDLKKKLAALKAEKETLEKDRQAIDDEIEKKLQLKLEGAVAKATKRVESKYAEQLNDLQTALSEHKESIKVYRENELELRKKQRELEIAKEDIELEIARKLDEERTKIRLEAESKVFEQHRLKDLEKDKVISDLKSALDDMKRKAEQGSMERQGEVLEQDFETQLKRYFPHDEIQPVPKGIRGADLIQIVRTPFGVRCGVILWETKNTKAWSGQWIPKLKDDMIETRAAIAILVSMVLPDEVIRFGMVDGVWVTDPLSAMPLATALRQHLVAFECERQASIGKNEKMELLYKYLSGTEFKQKMEGIIEAFMAMQSQVNKERRAMEKQWKEREKQIERVIKNTVGLYGDMQGIIGGEIPQIQVLELESETEEELPLVSDGESSDEDT